MVQNGNIEEDLSQFEKKAAKSKLEVRDYVDFIRGDCPRIRKLMNTK